MGLSFFKKIKASHGHTAIYVPVPTFLSPPPQLSLLSAIDRKSQRRARSDLNAPYKVLPAHFFGAVTVCATFICWLGHGATTLALAVWYTWASAGS